MVIFNEYLYVHQIIEDKKKPMNMSMKRLITYLCKYYYDKCKRGTSEEYYNLIMNVIDMFHFDKTEFEEYQYQDFIKKTCDKALSGDLNVKMRNNFELGITEEENKFILQAETAKERKLLFTLYILAKSYVSPTGWVNYNDTDIFKLANISGTMSERFDIARSLWDHGLIEVNHMIDMSGYKVCLDEDNKQNVFSITDFNNIGNQYLAYIHPDHMVCQRCGKYIKRNSPRQKYCKACSVTVKREAVERVREKCVTV